MPNLFGTCPLIGQCGGGVGVGGAVGVGVGSGGGVGVGVGCGKGMHEQNSLPGGEQISNVPAGHCERPLGASGAPSLRSGFAGSAWTEVSGSSPQNNQTLSKQLE